MKREERGDRREEKETKVRSVSSNLLSPLAFLLSGT